MPDNSKTGLFHRQSTGDYVVMWQGREIARYDSIEAFVTAHLDGLRALESTQADLLSSFYRSP